MKNSIIKNKIKLAYIKVSTTTVLASFLGCIFQNWIDQFGFSSPSSSEVAG